MFGVNVVVGLCVCVFVVFVVVVFVVVVCWNQMCLVVGGIRWIVSQCRLVVRTRASHARDRGFDPLL